MSKAELKKHLSTLGKKGGRSKSLAKRKAARKNLALARKGRTSK